MNAAPIDQPGHPHHGFTNAVVRSFLNSNLSLVLILLAAAVGLTALFVTPREEDPQIVVPLADVAVDFPGHSAAEVEQLVTTPLEKLLYEIDGVEYVYSQSAEGSALITVRFFVGQDRERSLVKLYKRIDEHLELVPPGVAGWVVKPVEIDDVPIVTLTLTGPSADGYTLRRVGEEVARRLSAVENLSRVYVVGGEPRVIHLVMDPDRLEAYHVAPLAVHRAIEASNVKRIAGDFTRMDESIVVEAGPAVSSADQLRDLVVGVFGDRPVFLKDVCEVVDGPAEEVSYVRHGWGPARDWPEHQGFPGTRIGPPANDGSPPSLGGAGGRSVVADGPETSTPAVTLAIAKKRGTNAVWVARSVLAEAERLKRDVIPDDVELIITRNAGLTADDKVNELVEALAVAIFIVIALLTLGLGWREALIVALAVPVVFGLTLAVNLLFGFSINRVTLFALILSLGLLVDDPIVDVENISRHFSLRRRATRAIVLEAVAEIRPPLITATLAVIVSFLPMFFITGMMGPYMRPMALNVPVAMLMSMLVAFTITPWLSYHVLGRRHEGTEARRHEGEERRDRGTKGPRDQGAEEPRDRGTEGGTGALDDVDDSAAIRNTALYRFFYPLMSPLLRSRRRAWAFLAIMAVLTFAAVLLPATRHVQLKMLPFDNKNELLFVLDFDEGTTLQRTDAAVRAFEDHLAGVPEVIDFTSFVGLASPMDFNGMVRHYYLRRGENVADIRVNFVDKKSRPQQSHAIGLRLRDEFTDLAGRHGATLKIVETPPGPPVLAGVVAEVYGRPDHAYEDLIAAARTVRARMAAEPGVVDVDDTVEADRRKLTFVADQEKAAIHGISVNDVTQTLAVALGGNSPGLLHVPDERHPLRIELRLPRPLRSSPQDLGRIALQGAGGALVPLAEIGRWEETLQDQTIYHKNLRRVVYVFGETAGRPPAEAVVDVLADQRIVQRSTGNGAAQDSPPSQGGAGGGSNAHGDRTSQEAHAAPRITPPQSPPEKGGSSHIAPSLESPRPLDDRTFLNPGSRLPWSVPDGIEVDFAGEGEWKITLDVFRDLGLAFAAALVGIYILLVAQTGSFAVPVVVMLAIPLNILGIMPGFWLLNAVAAGNVGGYADPIFFTATGMIGMIALAGIVTRDAIILVDFIHVLQRRGRSLFDAIMESRVVRLRPILLTAGTAMFSAAPITIDPIFSGLAWSLIFGLLASTVFTLFVIPVTYWLLYHPKEAAGSSIKPIRGGQPLPASSTGGHHAERAG